MYFPLQRHRRATFKPSTWRALFAVATLNLALFATTAAADFSHWRQHAADSQTEISHAAWDALLARYISSPADGVNRFAYGKVSKADARALDEYIQALEQVVVTSIGRAEQFAYWINLYNALTVKIILDNYPVDSIRDIRPTWYLPGPWKKPFVKVEGRALSLDNIEHDIMRPIFQDNRIHYAVNCASIGCPNLQPRAFTRANLEQLLEKSAYEYVNHPRGVRVENGDLIASSIYKWYGDDFGDSPKQIIAHFRKYAHPPLKKSLRKAKKIDSFFYDWELNDG